MIAKVVGAALLALALPAAVKVYGAATAVDGDGLRFIGDTEIRLFGIDAPELRGEPEAGRRARPARRSDRRCPSACAMPGTG